MTRKDLERLCDATNEICVLAAAEYEPAPDDAINWGDLSCAEARWVRNDCGDEYAEVVIEEASPGLPKFSAWVKARLAERGFPDVRVVTEW